MVDVIWVVEVIVVDVTGCVVVVNVCICSKRFLTPLISGYFPNPHARPV